MSRFSVHFLVDMHLLRPWVRTISLHALDCVLTLCWAPSTDFSQDSSVVVAELNNSQAGEVFGVSKIKNGNRMETVYLQSMMVVFYPPQGKASMRLTV
jgi:hypothetical protein